MQVRPDVLGFSAGAPANLGTTNINGGQISIEGKLVEEDENWLVIEGGTNGEQHFAVPREAIAMVTFVPDAK